MALKVLLVVLVLAGAYAQVLHPNSISFCGFNQIPTSKGCFNKCSSSQYLTCPNVFTQIYRPRFCGVR